MMAILILISLTVNVFAAPSYGQELNPTTKTYEVKFNDVPKTHWAFNYISEMVEKKAFSGYPDGLFRPDSIISRAEFAKIMVNAAGLKVDSNVSTSGFIDADDHWSKAFVAAAKPYLTGYINTDRQKVYLPDENALREDIAVAMVRLKGYDIKLADLSIIEKMFTDYDTMSNEVKPYIAIAVEKGLMSGYPDSTFKPQDSITRAEAATLLWRAFQYGNLNKITDTTKEIPTPSATSTPVTTPTSSTKPTTTVAEYTYGVDTLIDNVKNVTSMVIDNRGILHYIDGDFIKSSDGKQLDISKDFKFDLGYDDKNYKFSLYYANLAYDSYNDKLYLVANDYTGFLIIFSIDNYTPKMIMNRKNNKTIEVERPYVSPDSNDGIIDVDFLTTGAMIATIASNSGSGYNELNTMINLNGGSIKIIGKGTTKVINNKLFKAVINVKGAPKPEFQVYDISGTLIKTVSIENKYPIIDNFYRYKSYGDRMYFVNENIVGSVDTDGYCNDLINMEDLLNVDVKPILSGYYDQFVIDKNGNVIFYDKNNYCIRIIKKIQANTPIG